MLLSIDFRVQRLALLSAGLLLCGQASAIDFRFNGFGSIAVGKTISDEQLPGGNSSSYLVVPTFGNRDDGRANPDARHDDDWSWQPDTNLAFQLTASVNQDFSATAQLAMQGANDLDPEFEWLYLSYNFSDQLNFKAGKQRLPLYFYSDYLDVGYAYHWLRPPVDVYGEGASTYTGLSMLYETELGDWESSFHAYYGDIANDNAPQWRLRVDNVAGIVFTGTRDWLTLRASWHNSTDSYVDVESMTTLPALTITQSNPSEVTFASIGFMADFENYFIGGEYVFLGVEPYAEFPTFLAAGNATVIRTDERNSFMLTAGYRINALTYHATYSQRQATLAMPLNLNHYLDSERRSISAGIRWDFHDNMALKAEVTRATDHSEPGLKAALGETLENTVFAIGIDYVF